MSSVSLSLSCVSAVLMSILYRLSVPCQWASFIVCLCRVGEHPLSCVSALSVSCVRAVSVSYRWGSFIVSVPCRYRVSVPCRWAYSLVTNGATPGRSRTPVRGVTSNTLTASASGTTSSSMITSSRTCAMSVPRHLGGKTTCRYVRVIATLVSILYFICSCVITLCNKKLYYWHFLKPVSVRFLHLIFFIADWCKICEQF